MADVPRDKADGMDIEELLWRADFSRETDFKERLWKRLCARMEEMEQIAREEPESLVMDLSDEAMAQAAGGLNTNGEAHPLAKKIDV